MASGDVLASSRPIEWRVVPTGVLALGIEEEGLVAPEDFISVGHLSWTPCSWVRTTDGRRDSSGDLGVTDWSRWVGAGGSTRSSADSGPAHHERGCAGVGVAQCAGRSQTLSSRDLGRETRRNGRDLARVPGCAQPGPRAAGVPAEDVGMTGWGRPGRVGCFGIVVRHGPPKTADRLTTNGGCPPGVARKARSLGVPRDDSGALGGYLWSGRASSWVTAVDLMVMAVRRSGTGSGRVGEGFEGEVVG